MCNSSKECFSVVIQPSCKRSFWSFPLPPANVISQLMALLPRFFLLQYAKNGFLLVILTDHNTPNRKRDNKIAPLCFLQKVASMPIKSWSCFIQRLSSTEKHIDGEKRCGERQSVSGTYSVLSETYEQGCHNDALYRNLFQKPTSQFSHVT